MSIYVIADLHLSFNAEKPMNVFGDKWQDYEEKLKNNWIKKIKPDDVVILPGDFSWCTYLEEMYEDFSYLESLPGKKILLKGNHDYWWTTLTSMRRYLEENNFKTIDFLYNNSYCIEDKIIVGTRGWNIADHENQKIIDREVARLKLSIQDGIKNFGEDKEIMVFIHYPPITKEFTNTQFWDVIKNYNAKKCFYGHLHGGSHKDAVEGKIDDIEVKLISADYLDFDPIEL